MPRLDDITGQTFGKLTAIEYVGKRRWRCICACGKEPLTLTYNMKSGHTKSCGCAERVTHGMADTPTYKSWEMMIQRCTNPNFDRFDYYGGRGISISDGWTKFEKFYEDMGERPEGLTLERVDVNGDYCKSNCVWDDISRQSYNKRKLESNTSGRTGVNWHKAANKWMASIGYNGQNIYLGLRENFEDAVQLRKEAEMKYYGVFKSEDVEALV